MRDGTWVVVSAGWCGTMYSASWTSARLHVRLHRLSAIHTENGDGIGL